MCDRSLEKIMFPFDKPLTSRDGKKFVELLALGILQYYYKDIYNECEVKDVPDIQHRNKLIGVEVVEAISKEDAAITNEFAKYRLTDQLEEKERRKRMIENNGGEVKDFILSYPTINSDIERKLFQNALRKKMNKLPSYKSQGFEKMGVFIFYNEPLIPIKKDELKEYFDQVLNEYDDKYDILYFCCSGVLIEYNISSNDFMIKPIKRDVFYKLQYDTRLKVKK